MVRLLSPVAVALLLAGCGGGSGELSARPEGGGYSVAEVISAYLDEGVELRRAEQIVGQPPRQRGSVMLSVQLFEELTGLFVYVGMTAEGKRKLDTESRSLRHGKRVVGRKQNVVVIVDPGFVEGRAHLFGSDLSTAEQTAAMKRLTERALANLD